MYYIHGGGMTNLSCFDGMYRGWGKLVAANGVAVVMVDFRNAITPSSVPEVAPYPAGLDDCVLPASSGRCHTPANWASIPGGSWSPARAAAATLTLATGMRLLREGRIEPHVPAATDHVPLHRRRVAPGAPAVDVREQRHPPRPSTAGTGGLAYGIEAFEARTPSPGRSSPPWTTCRGLRRW